MPAFSRILGGLVAALLLVGPALAADTGAARDLVGLWQAKRRFGPEVRGDLELIREGAGWRAEIAGRSAVARLDQGVVSFALPGGEGAFRGRLSARGDVISGHWVQPRMVTNGSAYATPVELKTDGHDRWRGVVAPLDDDFTLYLQVSANPDGTTGVFLRNPERNIGVFVKLGHLVRDGRVVKLMGRPGGAKEDVAVADATYDADDEVLSVYVPNRGGTYDFTRADDQSGFYPRGKAPARYAYRPPLPRADGWPVGTLDEAGLSRPAIEAFVQMLIDTPIDSVHAQEVHGVLIARHGKLVLEEYFHGEHGDKLHDVRSAAKSLTATMVGAAIAGGAPLDPSTPVYKVMNGGDFPAGLEPRKRAMTLEHLLTMSSGFFCDDANPDAPGNEDVMQNQDRQPDWYRYALDLPMASAPGETTVYCSTNPNLAGGVLARATGERLEDLFDRQIAGPMQFGRYALNLQPTGQPYMGGGAAFRPRDFMKLGQVMLDGGAWHGRRILSRDWVARASAPLHDLAGVQYGYFWWVTDFPYRERKVRAFFAGGNGGQAVIVVPELDLVVAFYGGNYSDKALYVPQRVYVPSFILPAVK